MSIEWKVDEPIEYRASGLEHGSIELHRIAGGRRWVWIVKLGDVMVDSETFSMLARGVVDKLEDAKRIAERVYAAALEQLDLIAKELP